MAATITENDPYTFAPIQITTDEEARRKHQYNIKTAEGKEIQRPDVVDDLCQGMLLQARIDRIEHGYEKEGVGPATLIIFGFRFHGIDDERRFKKAIINVVFRDEQKRDDYDPVVTALWPNGSYTLGEPTEVETEQRTETELGGDLTGGNVVQGGAHAVRKWEKKMSFTKSDTSRLTGSIALDTSVRYTGPKNAVRLTISENRVAGSGVVTDLRIAVLLLRKNDTDIFESTAKMKGTADFQYNFIRGWRDVTGFSPPNDAVRFKPGVSYLRPATLGDVMETKLAEKIDTNNLNAVKIGDMAGILATTALVN